MVRTHPEFQAGKILPLAWGNLSYTDSGSGSPILLLHGTGRSRLDWNEIIAYLPHRRLIIPDLRGHGGSDTPKNPLTFSDLVEDILALTTHLELGRMDIVGHSLGGMLALEILKRSPERCGKIVSLEGWTRLTVMRRFDPDSLTCLAAEKIKLVEELNHDTFVRWMPGIRKKFWRTVEKFDGLPILRSTPHEILALYGDRNRSELPKQEELRVPARPNIFFHWLAGCGHFLVPYHAKLVGEHLRRFLLGECSEVSEPEDDRSPPNLLDLSFRPRW